MPYSSPFADVSIPETDLLSYLFPANQAPSRKQLWYDAAEPSQSLSPKQLLVWVKRVASGLERRGLGTGDVVLICTPNSLMVPAAYLGILGASCIFSAVNPTSTASEITHQLRDTGAQLVLAHPEALAKTLAAASAVGLPTTSIFQFSDDGECPVTDGIKDWSELLATIDEVNNYTWKRLSPEESRSTAAAINYSSGTTGLPKGVCISHYNIIANVEQNISIQYTRKPYTFEDRPEERWIGFLPLYHAFGQLYTIVMSIRYNAAVYIMRRFNFINFIEALAKYRVTTLHCVPPILVMLNKRPETAAYDLKSIREVIVGAAPLSKETQNAIAAKFDCVVCQGWGMTELTASGLACPGGVHDDSGSVGQLYPNSRCKLVDESGNEVPLGQPGELMIHGPQVCMGYWKNAEATADNITPEGWLKTGDIAICNDNGYFWIVDRKKELIKVNALQVAPAELESTLLQHPQVVDAGVVGIRLAEEEFPRAYVVLRPGVPHSKQVMAKEIQVWFQERVAKHKALAGGVQIVDEVPRLASGKIKRKVLKDWAKRDTASHGSVAKL